MGDHSEVVLPTGDSAPSLREVQQRPEGTVRRGRLGGVWGAEEGQSAGMGCDGDQAQCSQQCFTPCATSQAKHAAHPNRTTALLLEWKSTGKEEEKRKADKGRS